jgi:putative endonuclease
MFTVYVLRSLKNHKRYIGYTSKTTEERFNEHMSGTNKWTRHNKPFKIIHTETFNTKTEAIKREKYLKSGQGRKWLDNSISE